MGVRHRIGAARRYAGMTAEERRALTAPARAAFKRSFDSAESPEHARYAFYAHIASLKGAR